jgi:hypothetical protein
MKAAKKSKPKKEAHASSSQIGMGDFYGSGVKQSLGRIREDFFNNPVNRKAVKKAPKTLA